MHAEMEIIHAVMVLADISGYTSFVTKRETSLLHAERIITELMEAVINTAAFPLNLNKLEGDAAFLYALTDGNEAATAQDVGRQVMAFIRAFNRKASELVRNTAVCACDACRHIDHLRLKVILHAGEAAIKHVRQFEELAGKEVILLHRLLKNTIREEEYILMTEQYCQLSGGLPGAVQPPETRVEHVEGLGSVPVRVCYPSIERRVVALPHAIAPWRNWKSMFYIMRISLRKRNRKIFAHLPER
jgi:hypothetical protein